MSATLVITHRRLQSSPDGTHRHVGWVRLTDGRTLSRQEVLEWMRAGYLFATRSPLGHSARVTSVHCRRCGYVYLRSDRDMWKDDNLDMLPNF